jgi:hypothetical protein
MGSELSKEARDHLEEIKAMIIKNVKDDNRRHANRPLHDIKEPLSEENCRVFLDALITKVSASRTIRAGKDPTSFAKIEAACSLVDQKVKIGNKEHEITNHDVVGALKKIADEKGPEASVFSKLKDSVKTERRDESKKLYDVIRDFSIVGSSTFRELYTAAEEKYKPQSKSPANKMPEPGKGW